MSKLDEVAKFLGLKNGGKKKKEPELKQDKSGEGSIQYQAKDELEPVKKGTARGPAPMPPVPPVKPVIKYKERECPYCSAIVRNLPNHVKMKHPNEPPPVPHTQKPEMSRENLLSGKHKPAKITPGGGLTIIYYCTDCRAKLRYGEESCWKCGAVMDWTQVEKAGE